MFGSVVFFLNRGDENREQFFKIFGISRQKSRDIPPKNVVFPGFRRTYRIFWPPLLLVEDPHPTRRYLDQNLGTEKKQCDKNILPNVPVNFLVRFASKPLFHCVMTDNLLELFRKMFGAVRAIFWFCEFVLVPEKLGFGFFSLLDNRRNPKGDGKEGTAKNRS